jgi:hypothetical protein
MAGLVRRRREGSYSLFRIFFNVFFDMVGRWLHLEVRIRSYLPYTRSGGASKPGGVCMELCI